MNKWPVLKLELGLASPGSSLQHNMGGRVFHSLIIGNDLHCFPALGGSNSVLHKSKNISFLTGSDGFNSMPKELKFICLSSLGDALPSSLPKA